jgi:hypothetical protein
MSTHQARLSMLRHSIAGIAEGRLPLRDLSRPIMERNSGVTGPYFFTPGPLITSARNKPEGFGGYLNGSETMIDEGAFARLRVRRADSIVKLRHKGWFTDDDCIGELAFGIVATLARSRGFLAGWSLGGNMCASLSRTIYWIEQEAARAADREAELAAEKERDYQREQAAKESAGNE